jgi:YhcH/YjgK/YiaL family protein
MLIAHLEHPGTYHLLTRFEVWQQALDWIKTNAHKAEQGIYELRGQDMYVNVHGYDTLPEVQCRFESHKRYIDLQYCISGGERIAWQLTSNLIPDGDYDPNKDFQFYKPGLCAALLTLSPGSFVVFFPEDGHQPKQNDGTNQSVWKLVVKINCELL